MLNRMRPVDLAEVMAKYPGKSIEEVIAALQAEAGVKFDCPGCAKDGVSSGTMTVSYLGKVPLETICTICNGLLKTKVPYVSVPSARAGGISFAPDKDYKPSPPPEEVSPNQP